MPKTENPVQGTRPFEQKRQSPTVEAHVQDLLKEDETPEPASRGQAPAQERPTRTNLSQKVQDAKAKVKQNKTNVRKHQISLYVPVDLLKKFKKACAQAKINALQNDVPEPKANDLLVEGVEWVVKKYSKEK